MDHTEKIYQYLKTFIEKNGYPQSYNQIAEALNLKKYEVEGAMEELQQSGRIKITHIPSETKIEFVDWKVILSNKGLQKIIVVPFYFKILKK